MDIKKYIESGILENYILGLASETEIQEVEQHLQSYPELKTELHKIEDALSAYAQSKAMPMPEGLSASILQTIQQLETTPSAVSDNASTTTKPQAAKPNFLAILLGLALAGSLLSSFFLYQQKQDLQNQLVLSQTQATNLNDRLVALQLDCDQKDQTIQAYQEQIAVLKNPAYQPISMKGTEKAPNAVATVYFSPVDNKTYLDIGNLPAAPTDKDYQLWAIVDGTPTDMGIFDLTATNGLVEVPHIQNPQAFAVTLETKGGNPSPNLNELYVIGNV